jgi:hypothetical protein
MNSMKFSIEYHSSLPEMAVAFTELEEFRIFPEDGPSTASSPTFELGTISVDDDGVFREGMKPLLM